MLKTFIPIVVALFVGWFSHVLYSSSYEKKSIKHIEKECFSENEIEIEFETIEKIVIKEVIKYVPKIIYKTKELNNTDDNITKDMFMVLLKKDLFYEAMDYYEEAEEEKQASYRTILIGYFSKIQGANLFKAIAQMRYFIDIEEKSKVVVFQLVNLFVKHNRYRQAITLLIDFSYVAPYGDKTIIYSKIKSISTEYISKLLMAKDFEELIEFLKAQIDMGILSEFYAFELVQVYLVLEKYEPAIALLEVLVQDEIYKERATQLLSLIEMKLEEQREYPIKIPLIRYGLHFLVNAYVDGSSVTLLLDTGASITTIDANLISNLKVLKENVTFHTAGGDISESIFQANSFSIAEVSLDNFRISGSSYPSRNYDGLLGMNFFSKFKFKIDQDNAILLLGAKNRK